MSVAIDIFGNSKDDVIESYVKLWRNRGYPHYQKSDYNMAREFAELVAFDEKAIFRNGVIKQTMHSCGLLWTYFPHWIDVKYGEQKTIRELWNDDDKLTELVRKTFDYEQKHGSGYITVNRLRQNSKVYLSKQSVSNFRPSAAKFIYNRYGNSGNVWDMSCGWGGRLLGFLASDCKSYIGTEPASDTFDGLTSLNAEFNNGSKMVTLLNMGSEEYLPQSETLDLCFTSPPYFDTEKYSDEDSQSYVKYPTKDAWLIGFYRKTIENCYHGLKGGGKMLINISNTQKHNWLESETISISTSVGFDLSDTIRLELSSISGSGAKYEPIFILTKPHGTK
jgi:hypothetical protein